MTFLPASISRSGCPASTSARCPPQLLGRSRRGAAPPPPPAYGGTPPSEAAAALQDVMRQFVALMQQAEQQQQQPPRPRDALRLRGVTYRPPGSPQAILADVSLDLPANSLGLVYGRSGSGKTTLLHVVAGLLEASDGSITLGEGGQDLDSGRRLAKAGMVFQFPERHFLGGTILEELSVGVPRCVRIARGQRWAPTYRVPRA